MLFQIWFNFAKNWIVQVDADSVRLRPYDGSLDRTNHLKWMQIIFVKDLICFETGFSCFCLSTLLTGCEDGTGAYLLYAPRK